MPNLSKMNLRTVMAQLHRLETQARPLTLIETVRREALIERLSQLVQQRGEKQRAIWAAIDSTQGE